MALKKLHNKNIIHFDLKGPNIFMLNQYTPVLGDFGFTMFKQQADDKSLMVGTPLYLGYKVMNGLVPFSRTV